MQKIISLALLLCFSVTINSMDKNNRVGSNQKDPRTELGRRTEPQNKAYKTLRIKEEKKRQDLERKQERKNKTVCGD